MKKTELNGIHIYDLSAGKTLPEWLKNRTRKSLKDDDDFRHRLELIQDFTFPASCSRIEVSPSGDYIMAAGVYTPRIKVYECNELSMKFQRHLDCEVVDFAFLSDHFRKLVLLEADRSVEFHTSAGVYYKTRIPKPGRAMMYEKSLCDLYAVGSSLQVYRLNLEQGRFLKPLDTKFTGDGINCCALSPVHCLLAFGSASGEVECFDPRASTSVGFLQSGDSLQRSSQQRIDYCPEITAVQFASNNAFQFCVGTESGHCLLYDVRSSRPMLVKDHRYESPIHKIHFHGSDKIVSADRKIVKIWNTNDASNFCHVEPPAAINDVCLATPNQGGLIYIACEQPKIQTYYIPELGQAPTWCSFLENITEELEHKKKTTIYDDFKFVTREQLENLGLDKLIGTNYLRAYMHGFFMDIRLYNKVQSLSDPFAYEKYRKQKIQERIAKRSEDRISLHPSKKQPRVNQKLAKKLQKEQDDEGASSSSSSTTTGSSIIDDRFKDLLDNPDFQVSINDKDYHRLKAHQNFGQFERLASESSDDDNRTQLLGDDLAPLQSSDDDERIFVNPEMAAPVRKKQKKTSKDGVRMFGLDRGAQDLFDDFSYNQKGGVQRKLVEKTRKERAKNQPLGDVVRKVEKTRKKVEKRQATQTKRTTHGNVEITFEAADDKKKRQQAQQKIDDHRKRKRRSIRSLKMKKLPSYQTN